MIRCRTIWLVASILSVGFSPSPVVSQYNLDSLLKASGTRLDFTAEESQGPGFDFILDAAANAQFVVVGESHNVMEIPQFTSQLFSELHRRYGFNYLALEDGPFIADLLSDESVRGNSDATLQLVNRYVNALQFWTDQEIDLILDVGRGSQASAVPIWGLDNAWGGLHILEALLDLAPTEEARSLVSALVEEVREREARRPVEGRIRFIVDTTTASHVDRLQSLYATAGEVAQRLIDVLETANYIYRIRTSRPNIYLSNSAREDYMRHNFVQRYRSAERRDRVAPKVILKFGQVHAVKARNNTQVMALGSFVSEFAKSHGTESLHIWTGLVNEPGHFWTLHDFEDYVPLAEAGSTEHWTVIDFRPLRPLIAANQVEGLNSELHRVIFGFDIGLLIGGGNRATRNLLSEGGERY